MPLKPHFRRGAVKLLGGFVAALTAVSLLATVSPAGADQLANDRAEAEMLANKIEALGLREGALGEQYNAGVIALNQANAQVTDANKKLAAAKASQQKTIGLLRQAAVQAYVGGGTQMQLANSVPLKNMNEALLRQELEDTFATAQSDALSGYRLAAADESTAQAQLERARNTKAAEVALLARDKAQVLSAEYKLEALEQQVKGNIATLVAEIERQRQLAEQRAEEALLAKEKAAAEAAARAEAAREAQAEAAARAEAEREAAAQLAAERAATTTTTPSSSATTVPSAPVTTAPPATSAPTATAPTVPGENPLAPQAIAAAESRVGDPYVWGGSGPDVFDCSGLMMWAWSQVGVYLPHYSGAQYADTIHIPMSDLQPGDLVFPADPGEHVAMYIGNGEIVQAPYTGADVQVVPLTSFFVLASEVG